MRAVALAKEGARADNVRGCIEGRPWFQDNQGSSPAPLLPAPLLFFSPFLTQNHVTSKFSSLIKN